MKFLRHLGAATLLVGLTVGLAYAWRASPAASIVADSHDRPGGDRPHGAVPSGTPPDGDREFERGRDRRNGGFDIGSIDELVQPIVIYGLMTTAVVVIDRRRRAARRDRLAAHKSSA